MNKFITIGDQKVSITEIENAKSIPELLQTRVQYAILDQLNDMVARAGMGNPDEVKKLVLRDMCANVLDDKIKSFGRKTFNN